MAEFRLPDTSHRIFIPGATGSGKTVFGSWILAHAPFDRQRYYIIDYKREEFFGKLRGIDRGKLTDTPIRTPGITLIRPEPGEDEAVEKFLWKVWKAGNIGIFVDEGFMFPTKTDSFNSILTQGRSKNIPCIVLTQRPVDVSRYAVSQADFYAKFRLQDRRDDDTVRQFIPDPRVKDRLPEFHSHWYDVGQDLYLQMKPVPDKKILRDIIENRLRGINNRMRFV